jgi:phage tail protein X
MTTYTTRQGDMWDLIAFRLTGSTEQVEKIMQANPKYAKTYIFSAGVELNIPELNSVVDYDTLPPWKRV